MLAATSRSHQREFRVQRQGWGRAASLGILRSALTLAISLRQATRHGYLGRRDRDSALSEATLEGYVRRWTELKVDLGGPRNGDWAVVPCLVVHHHFSRQASLGRRCRNAAKDARLRSAPRTPPTRGFDVFSARCGAIDKRRDDSRMTLDQGRLLQSRDSWRSAAGAWHLGTSQLMSPVARTAAACRCDHAVPTSRASRRKPAII